MTRDTKTTAISLTVLLAFSLTGCATTGLDQLSPPTAESSANMADINYTVQSGDRLSEIALRFTGEISNWQVIATRNDINNPRNLAVGAVLIIPGKLLQNKISLDAKTRPTTAPTADTGHAASMEAPNGISDTTPAHTASAPPVTTGNGVSVLRGLGTQESADFEDSSDIILSAVSINRTFDLQPVEAPSATDNAGARYDSEAPEIRVNGTYYPKGVYEQPASYSRLIGRVAPGAIFQLDSEVNDWYKIVTDQGIGYIRQSDSALIR